MDFSRQWLNPCKTTNGVFIACMVKKCLLSDLSLALCSFQNTSWNVRRVSIIDSFEPRTRYLYQGRKITSCEQQIEERQYQAGTTEVWVQFSAHSQISCIILDETFSFSMHQLLICKLRMNNYSFALAFYLKCKLLGIEASTYCWQLHQPWNVSLNCRKTVLQMQSVYCL